MKTKNLLLASIVVLFAQACQQANNHEVVSNLNLHAQGGERKNIMEGDMQIHVNLLAPSLDSITSYIHRINGRVISYDIQSNIEAQTKTLISVDSVLETKICRPEAHLKVQLPRDKSPEFLHALLTSNAYVENLKLAEQDVTDESAKLEMEKNVTVIEINANSKSEKQAYAHEKVKEQINQQILQSNLGYKSEYLWLAINLKADELIQRRMLSNSEKVSTPLLLQISKAVVVGWRNLMSVIVALFPIWPILLVSCLIWLFIKRGTSKSSFLSLFTLKK